MFPRFTAYLFFIALLFASVNSSWPVSAGGDGGDFYAKTIQLNKTGVEKRVSLERRLFKKDHIKIRYRGGDIRFSTPTLGVCSYFPVSIPRPVSGYSFFTPTTGSFLFKLRGPPFSSHIV